MQFDLENMGIEDLRELKKSVERAIASFDERRRKDAMAALEQHARELGFTGLSEVTGAGARKRRSSGPVAAKYANPDDPSQTWSGRGRRPHWVSAQLDNGRSMDDLAI